MFTLLAAPALFAKPVKRHPAGGVKERYLVLLEPAVPGPAVDDLARSLAATYGLRLVTTWEHLKGFACEGPLDAASALAADTRVNMVEEDHLMYGSSTISTSVDLNGDNVPEDLWYLDRLDDETWANGRNDAYRMCPTASNTTAYVLDEAVSPQHSAFEGRVIRTIDCTEPGANGPVCVERDAAEICRLQNSHTWVSLSHGTAVASLLTGKWTGAARPEIISVNVFPCTNGQRPFTYASYVASALNWIHGDVSARRNAGDFRAIVNHSGYAYPWNGESSIVMESVRQVVGLNIPYFTSADNFSGDACAFTPNMYSYTRNNRHWTRVVFTVAGTTMSGGVVDGRMTGTADVAWATPGPWGGKSVQDSGTNLGDCVSAFAPAVYIHKAQHKLVVPSDPSSAPDPTHYTNLRDGTSWSSPLAAAVALRWMAGQGTLPYYTQVYDFLLDNGRPALPTHTNAAYTVCYNPDNATQWEYKADPDAQCTSPMEPYRMQQASNTSGAGMIYWSGTCW